MATRRKLQKVFALLLAASMTMSLLSVGAFAADENGEETVKLSSVTLPEEYQDGVSVAYGTAEGDIGLPQTLVGTVEEKIDPPVEGVETLEEGEDVQTPGEDEDGQKPGEGEDGQKPGEGEDGQKPGEGENGQASGETVQVLMNTKMEPATETTVEVPVTWSCDSYDG